MNQETQRTIATLLIALDRVLNSRRELLPYLRSQIIQSVKEEIGKVSVSDVDEFLNRRKDD